MADRFSKEQRSRLMSLVKNKNTEPEVLVRKRVFAAGFRFRLHCKDLPGSPDLVLPKYRTAVFIHGCFWHGHDCPRGRRPATNISFWDGKIAKNIARDTLTRQQLRQSGWTVCVIWTCRLEADAAALVSALNRRRSVPGQRKA